MTKNRFIRSIIIVLITMVLSCLSDKSTNEDSKANETSAKKIKGDRPNLNISLLLDLSDRIAMDDKNAAMTNFQKDLGYIQSVTKAFEVHLRNKKSRSINDKIQVFLSPEPSDNELNKKIESLRLEFNRGNATKENIITTSVRYDSIIKLIYSKAINEKSFPGSDIWRFFKNNIKDFCVEDDFRNILVIITDGYMYHEDTKLKEMNLSSYLTSTYIKNQGLNTKDWRKKIENEGFGYIPVEIDLKDLDIIVLGVESIQNNIIEEEIIKTYWNNWFNKMNVGNSQIKTAELPSNLDNFIQNFILGL